MRKTLILSAMAAALLAITVGAKADASYAAFMFNALDKNGAAIHDGTYEMVIDVTGNGVVDASVDNSKVWQWDPTDIVLDYGAIGVKGGNNDGECYPFATLSASRPAGVDATDSIYLVWVDKPFLSATPGANTSYGVENLGSVGADPGDYSYFPNGGVADQVTAPEPASMGLLALALGAIVARRRNRKA